MPTPVERRRLWRRRNQSKPHQPSLFANDAFLLFWISRLVTQTGQGALIYALLIIVVDRTDASFYNSLFVICAILPSLAFGLPAGIVVDAVPRRPLLVCLNLLRFLFALALVASTPSLVGIFAAALGIWTIHQFYSPSESATLASIVPKYRYTSAQALSNLALTLAQLVGLVILAPVLLKTAGPTALFGVCALLFVAGATLTALLPRFDEHLASRGARQSRSIKETLLDGWRTTRRDDVIYEVMIADIVVGIGGSALVVITPLYLRGVLDTAAENTVFVFAPAALGLVIGLRLSSKIGRLIGERRVATAGLMLFAACVGALGFVVAIREFLNQTLRIRTDRVADALHVPPLILLVMLISIPAGFASAIVSVSARSVLLARTPSSKRGQVIATQSLLQNLGALVPTLLVGIMADLIGVEKVAVAIAAIMAGSTIAALTFYRPTMIASTSG